MDKTGVHANLLRNGEDVMIGSDLSKDIVEFFMKIPIFDRINAEEIKVIARHMNIMSLKENDTLFMENEKGNYVCFIVNGELEVIKKSEASGKDVILATLGTGQSIGEMAIIDDYPRSATIRAKTGTDLYILSKSAFDLIMDRHAKIAIKLLKGIACLLSQNLRETSARLADYMPPIS